MEGSRGNTNAEQKVFVLKCKDLGLLLQRSSVLVEVEKNRQRESRCTRKLETPKIREIAMQTLD